MKVSLCTYTVAIQLADTTTTGHSVTVLVRDASALEPQTNLTVVEGSVLSKSDMDRAVTAAGVPVDGALIFLNARRASNNPWATFVGPPRLVADSTANVARALRAQYRDQQPARPRPRLVIMNALGVGDSYGVTPYIIRFIMTYSNVSKSYEDHTAVNDEIEADCGDDISWTLAMPVGLTHSGPKPVRTFDTDQSGASLFITRESCARWMVDVASGKLGDEFSNRRVIVSN